MSATLAIVILNWNGRELLEKFLPSVVKYTDEMHDIVVADNGSTDDSLSWLEHHYPTVIRLPLGTNYGFAGGYNRALQSLSYDFFLLLNSDVEVTPHWIDPLLNALLDQPDVAAVMPKILDYYDKNRFEYAGAAGGFIDYYGIPYCRGRIFATREEDHGQYDQPIDVHWTSGAAMLIRAELFSRMGGFDESYFAHMEEVDLCWRLMNQGFRLKCIPQSSVYHAGGATLSYDSPRKLYLNARNSQTTVLKNHPAPFLPLLFRVVLDVAAFVVLIVSGKGTSALAIIRANIDFYGMIGIKKRVPASNSTIQYQLRKGSILFRYFLRRKRLYSSLELKNPQ